MGIQDRHWYAEVLKKKSVLNKSRPITKIKSDLSILTSFFLPFVWAVFGFILAIIFAYASPASFVALMRQFDAFVMLFQ